MAFSLSVGDIMLLSSLAWKIRCAFTSGRSGAPSEFREVEEELISLQTSITSLADTLDKDDSILSRADQDTQEGLQKILSSCCETLQNLESLVNQYQEIRRTEGTYRVATPRVWKASVVRNYKKLLWTSEGGNIQALRSMLQLHVGSTNVMVQAIQSQSLARLENTIHPMADKVDGIHSALVGNIDAKIAEMHDLMRTMASPATSPSLNPISRRDTIISVADTLVAESSNQTSPNLESHQSTLKPHNHSVVVRPSHDAKGNKSQDGPLDVRSGSQDSSRTNSLKSSGNTPISTPYETPPTVFADSGIPTDHFRSPHVLQDIGAMPTLDLPQPAIATSDVRDSLKLPSAVLLPSQHSPRNAAGLAAISAAEESQEDTTHIATVGQNEAFERAVFDHSLTLCTGKGVSVDFTQRNPSEEYPEEEKTKLTKAMEQCKISIVTKMRSNSAGKTRHITSIWALSDDRETRMQQELSDDTEIVPYTVWGKPTSVVLGLPTELTYHNVDILDKPVKTVKTSWVNYHFEDEQDSKAFQSALMWKRLKYSFCTRRTMLAHEGFVSSTFSFQEQLCGLENLRLWRDEEAGSTIAMIHYSPLFHEGYLSFRLNGPGTTAKVVDEGERWVKVKKLNIVLEPRITSASPSPQLPSPEVGGRRRRSEGRKIPAVKIEFSSMKEKYKFLEICGKAKSS